MLGKHCPIISRNGIAMDNAEFYKEMYRKECAETGRLRAIIAAILAMFSWCAYLDGNVWGSGLCAGVAAVMFLDFVQAWTEKPRRHHIRDRTWAISKTTFIERSLPCWKFSGISKMSAQGMPYGTARLSLRVSKALKHWRRPNTLPTTANGELSHRPRHEAPDREPAPTLDGPDQRSAVEVRAGQHGSLGVDGRYARHPRSPGIRQRVGLARRYRSLTFLGENQHGLPSLY